MHKRVENLEIKCFMCKKFATKLKENKTLTSEEEYHLTADLAAIEKLRRMTENARQIMK